MVPEGSTRRLLGQLHPSRRRRRDEPAALVVEVCFDALAVRVEARRTGPAIAGRSTTADGEGLSDIDRPTGVKQSRDAGFVSRSDAEGAVAAPIVCGYAHDVRDVAMLIRQIRTEAGMSLRSLAEAAGLATSTVHRIEQGRLRPTMETLQRIGDAAGVRIVVEPELDHAISIVGLARSIAADVAAGDQTTPVRKAAELVHRFEITGEDRRKRMIAGEPPSVGDRRWDAFMAALAEWLAVRGGLTTPTWARRSDRYLRRGWWVTPMTSMRAWEYAGSPMSFQSHGVYLHRESLTNV